MHYPDIDKINDPGELFNLLAEIMEKLRSENGCMWDREQTHDSIKRNMLEEAYEAIEAIELKNYQDLKEELGDILLQVVFHSRIAEDQKNFDLSDVLKTIIKKLVRRHPHVFGDVTVQDSSQVLKNWEDIKKKERREKQNARASMFSNIPKLLPSLHYAYEIQNRASRLGFDWDNLKGVLEKICEEISELNHEIQGKLSGGGKDQQIRDEIGDLIFSIVNLSRHLKVDSEQCLKETCRKFIRRFDFMEEYAEKNGIDFKSISLAEKDKLWEIAKKSL